MEAARRESEDTVMKQLIREELSRFVATQETPMRPAVAGEEDASPGGNESRAGGQDKNARAPAFAPSSEPHYLDWKTILATALPGFENGLPPDNLRRPWLFPITLDRVLEYLLGNPRLQSAAEECYHAACYGAFIAGSAVELYVSYW
eukprot:jgi/Tetstr1/432008/TSEL_021484.t1